MVMKKGFKQQAVGRPTECSAVSRVAGLYASFHPTTTTLTAMHSPKGV